MTAAGAALLLILVGYLAGAIPWGLVIGRLVAHVDIRRYGSGSTGATNALRVLGWRASAVVFLLDFLKGLLPVLLARATGRPGWVVAAVGIAAVLGHCWSPFIGFTGGKGMATGAGAATAIAPWILLLLPMMVLVVALTRYVSLGSILTSLAAAVAILVAALLGQASWAGVVGVAVMAAVIVGKHRGNIRRLLAGTERRLGEPAGPPASAGRA